MLRLLTAGESHGPELVLIVEGLPAGLDVPVEEIDRDLARRQMGYGRSARSTRIERDRAEVVGGLASGKTTGAPVAIRIVNRDFANQPTEATPLFAPRPGHADLTGRLKYGLHDFRLVRERASARETAARVAAGAIAKRLLAAFGAWVCSFVLEVAGVAAALEAPLDVLAGSDLERLARAADQDALRCPDPNASVRMLAAIDEARARGETVGGVFVVVATGAPPGLGSYVHWDRRLDGRLAQALCSIQAVKGVEIGPAFELARHLGTRAQDPIEWREGSIVRTTNRAGGLEGGVTSGEPIVLRAAMKPLSSVRAEMASVDFRSGETANPPVVRSDVCAVPAAAVVGEGMVAWVLADALTERFGQDRMDAMLAAHEAVRGVDLPASLRAGTPEEGAGA
jgi:chorismate synthase